MLGMQGGSCISANNFISGIRPFVCLVLPPLNTQKGFLLNGGKNENLDKIKPRYNKQRCF